MKKFKVIAPMGAVFGVGVVLQLTADQYKSRATNLDKLSKTKGCYRVKEPVQFKQGELVGLDGEVNKALLEMVTSAGKPTKKKDVKPSPKDEDEKDGVYDEDAQTLDEGEGEDDEDPQTPDEGDGDGSDTEAPTS